MSQTTSLGDVSVIWERVLLPRQYHSDLQKVHLKWWWGGDDEEGKSLITHFSFAPAESI